MLSQVYPLPSFIPEDIKNIIYLHLISLDNTPSARAFKPTLIKYYNNGKRFIKDKDKDKDAKGREWNIYTYWGIQVFGKQCEINSRNSFIYPIEIWCDIRLSMCKHQPVKNKSALDEINRLELMRKSHFRQRLLYVFGYRL